MSKKQTTSKLVSIIHLGCPKNLVDTEKILAHLALDGYLICQQPQESDIVLINTCGFIDSARQESREVLNEMLELKQSHQVEQVIAVGCMVELLKGELRREFPDLDGMIGFCNYDEIPAYLRAISKNKQDFFAKQGFVPTDDVRLRVTSKNFAYLRISEGCSNCCSYCNIPKI